MRSLAILGQVAEAERHIDQSIEGQPDQFHAHATKGILLSMRGKYKEAKASYLAAMRIDPTVGDPHLNLAADLLKRDKVERAATELQYATVLMPDDAKAFGDYAGVLKRLGRDAEALVASARAQALLESQLTNRALGRAIARAEAAPSPRLREVRVVLERLSKLLFENDSERP
jgi:tetratricopeptide (TPR) repeat protein